MIYLPLRNNCHIIYFIIYYLEICHILLDNFILEANINSININNNNNNTMTITEFNQLKTLLSEQAINRKNRNEDDKNDHSLVIIGIIVI